MQVLSRGIAATVALLLVVGGVLATHHQATIRHVRDAGAAFAHAAELAGHHTGDGSDFHGQRSHGVDIGDCALLTAFHQPMSASTAALLLVTARRTCHRHDIQRSSCAAAACEVYRLAPKTSPPATV
jgi:hypothetical protein